MKWHKIFLFGEIAVPTIPKVAISSIQNAFQCHGYFPQGMSKMTLEEIGNRRVLVLTRNPYDRLVSLYHNKIVLPEALLSNDVSHEQFGFWHGMPFDTFIEAVCKVSDDEADRHFRSQTALLTIDGVFIPTDTWQFDEIGNFWAEIQKYVSVGNLPHKNRSRKRQPSYYNERLRELVRVRYAEDFTKFGYTF